MEVRNDIAIPMQTADIALHLDLVSKSQTQAAQGVPMIGASRVDRHVQALCRLLASAGSCCLPALSKRLDFDYLCPGLLPTHHYNARGRRQ